MDEVERYDIAIHLKVKHGYTDERLAQFQDAEWMNGWHLTIHEHWEDPIMGSFISVYHEHSVMDYADLHYPEQAKKANSDTKIT